MVQPLRRRPCGKPSAVDPDHDGELLIGACGGRPDVEIQAVFARRRKIRDGLVDLQTRPAEGVGLPYARPLRGRLGRAPAQISDGRGRERDAAIDHQSVLGRAFEQTAVNPDGAGRCGARQQQRDDKRDLSHRPSPCVAPFVEHHTSAVAPAPSAEQVTAAAISARSTSSRAKAVPCSQTSASRMASAAFT